MDCTREAWPGNKEYLRDFNQKVKQQHVPLSGNFDLTHRCNLRCVHCYLRDQSPGRDPSSKELDTRQWRAIIDEVTEAGCLYLLLTGGEPLLRQDFSDIYRYAKIKGLLITVFTNGTLITPDIIKLFRELPPRAVEISLYGATAGTYESVTGVKGSFERCMTGIKSLKESGINIRLKTILMKLNSHEFFDIEKMARDLDVQFRFDAALFPRLNGDKTPLELRVLTDEVVEKEFSDPERSRQYRDFFKKNREIPVTSKLYQCGAGKTHFHVNPYGILQPCLMVHEPSYNLEKGIFRSGWEDVLPRIGEIEPGMDYLCNQCNKRSLCGFCPGFFKMETDAEDHRSEYLCRMGKLRYERINETL